MSSDKICFPLNTRDGYHLPHASIIETAITSKSKALLLTNPNNPTGTVFTKKELLTLLAIAKKYDLFIIADETYRGISFDGKRCYNMFGVVGKKERQRIIIIDSVSKRLNVCGAPVLVRLSPPTKRHNTRFFMLTVRHGLQ